MNSDASLNLLKQLLTLVGGILATAGLLTASQMSELTQDIIVAVPALVSLGSIVWSVYSHFGMKKVPVTATALALPIPPPPVGSTVNLTPMTGTVKVVG